jgi:hypothetical protein
VQEFGQNFDDMLPLPLEDSPVVVHSDASSVSMSGASLVKPGSLYMDYVPRVVPRAARTTVERVLMDSSSVDASTPKRLRSLGA